MWKWFGGVLAAIIASVIGWWVINVWLNPVVLSLVDATIADGPCGTVPTLDLKVKNDGRRTVVLTHVIFTVENVWELTEPRLVACLALPPSFKYQVDLPQPTSTTVTVSRDVDISQEVEPNRGDRFTFALRAKQRGVYRIHVRLNGDLKKPVDIGPLVFGFGPLVSSSTGFDWEANKRTAASIKAAAGVKTRYVQEVLDEILKAPSSPQ